MPASLALVTASSAYGIGRSTSKLVDRGEHGQTLNPKDSQARLHWIGVVGGVVGLGTMGAAKCISNLARQGEAASKFAMVTYNAISISSLALNGAGIVDSIIDLAQKGKEDITAMDVITVSINFFSFHTVLLLQKIPGD
jgi:hypothetical protein